MGEQMPTPGEATPETTPEKPSEQELKDLVKEAKEKLSQKSYATILNLDALKGLKNLKRIDLFKGEEDK